MDLRTRLEAFRQEEQRLNWEGTFADYFDQVVKRPPDGPPRPRPHLRHDHRRGRRDRRPAARRATSFFEDEIFGIEEPLEQLVEYFNSAAQRLEVRKRILLLMGPVGGGKSTIVTMLKRGLERYTRTDDGAVYAIKGCPMHEEPLHLIPDELRAEIEKRVRHLHRGRPLPASAATMLRPRLRAARHEDVRVERIAFSEKHRVGIGTFSPSDPKSQDITELTGSIDLSTIGEVGVESDPRAYRFDGELNIANRGLMEFIEMLKCDEKFLYVLLTLSQEQNIKTGRFSMIYADEVHRLPHQRERVRRLRRQPQVGGPPGPHHPRQVPYNLRVSRRGADLREAAQPERVCATSTSRRTPCASPPSSPSCPGSKSRRRRA